TTVAARIAFLRIHLHHQFCQGAHEANWEKIDMHLESLRSNGYIPDFFPHRLASLLMELEQRLWNGKTTADKTDHLNYGFPTKAVISAQAASFSATPQEAEDHDQPNNTGR
ncbi:hypothetical protein VP01_14677g1, partial [Puccinia sorghi]